MYVSRLDESGDTAQRELEMGLSELCISTTIHGT